jgi:hypothetical protein
VTVSPHRDLDLLGVSHGFGAEPLERDPYLDQDAHVAGGLGVNGGDELYRLELPLSLSRLSHRPDTWHCGSASASSVSTRPGPAAS